MKFDNSKYDKNGKLKNGLHRDHFKDGSVSAEGHFKNGERTGEWKYYLLTGKLKAIGNYTHGKITGEWKWYRENGKLMQTGSFDNDEKKTGTWIRYKESGTLLDKTELLKAKKLKLKNKKDSLLILKLRKIQDCTSTSTINILLS